MPGCVLRVSGDDFDVDRFIGEMHLRPCVVWRRGERRSGSGGAERASSGFNLLVSDDDGYDFPHQVADAINYLRANTPMMRQLASLTGVRSELDFGVTYDPDGDIPWPSYGFAPELAKLAGAFDLTLRLSMYYSQADAAG